MNDTELLKKNGWTPIPATLDWQHKDGRQLVRAQRGWLIYPKGNSEKPKLAGSTLRIALSHPLVGVKL